MSRAVLALCLLAMVSLSSATHFRFMTTNWERTNPNSREVRFELEQAWRKTFYTGINTQIISPPQTIGTDTWRFGQGSASVFMRTVPSSEDRSEDWFLGTAVHSFTYSADTTYTAFLSSGDRISTLAEGNSDAAYRVETLVYIDPNYQLIRCPRLTGLPIVQVFLNTLNTYNVPVGAPTVPGATLEFYIPPTGANAGGSGLRDSTPNGLTVDSNTGVISWTPTLKALYAFQVRVRQIDPQGRPTIFTTLDFIFEVVDPPTASNDPPELLVDSPTAAFQAVVTKSVLEGQTITFDVFGVDPVQPGAGLNHGVEIVSSALPMGATLSPCTPDSNNDGLSDPNTCQRTFTWTPPQGASSVSLLLFPRDGNNLQGQQVTINIDVLPGVVGVDGTLDTQYGCELDSQAPGFTHTLTGQSVPADVKVHCCCNRQGGGVAQAQLGSGVGVMPPLDPFWSQMLKYCENYCWCGYGPQQPSTLSGVATPTGATGTTVTWNNDCGVLLDGPMATPQGRCSDPAVDELRTQIIDAYKA